LASTTTPAMTGGLTDILAASVDVVQQLTT
jgi:hypothetical protein